MQKLLKKFKQSRPWSCNKPVDSTKYVARSYTRCLTSNCTCSSLSNYYHVVILHYIRHSSWHPQVKKLERDCFKYCIRNYSLKLSVFADIMSLETTTTYIFFDDVQESCGSKRVRIIIVLSPCYSIIILNFIAISFKKRSFHCPLKYFYCFPKKNF